MTPIAFPILNPETQTGVRKKYEHSDYTLIVVKNDDTLKLEFIWKGDGQKYNRELINKDISDISTGELFSSMNDIDYLEKVFQSIHQPNFINSPNLSYHYLVESKTFRITISQKIQNLVMGNDLDFGFEIIVPEIGGPDSQWVLQTRAQEIIDKTKYLSIDVESYFNQLMFTQEPEEIVRIGRIILNIQELNGQNWSSFKDKHLHSSNTYQDVFNISTNPNKNVYKSLTLSVFMLIIKWYQDERIMSIILKVSTNMTNKQSIVEINFNLLLPILEFYEDNLEMKINLLSSLKTIVEINYLFYGNKHERVTKVLNKLIEEVNSDNILVIIQFFTITCRSQIFQSNGGTLSIRSGPHSECLTRLLRSLANFCCEETNNFILILYLITDPSLMFSYSLNLLHETKVSQWLEEVISNYAHNYHLLTLIKSLESSNVVPKNNLMTVNALLDKFQQ